MVSFHDLPYVLQKIIYEHFMNLCRIEHISKFKSCIQIIPLKSTEFKSILHLSFDLACRIGSMKTISSHIKVGYRHNSPATFMKMATPIENLIRFRHLDCLRLVLSNPNCLWSGSFSTAIDYAVKYDNIDALQLLMDYGLFVTSQTLIDSIQNNRYSVTKYLIESGYKIDILFALNTGCFKAVKMAMDDLVDPTSMLTTRNIIGTRKRFYDSIYVACCNRSFIALYALSEGIDNVNGVFCVLESEIDSCVELKTLKKRIRNTDGHRFSFLFNDSI